MEDDCPLSTPVRGICGPPWLRLTPRLVLSGNGIRCKLPVALMETCRNDRLAGCEQLLAGWALGGHHVWTVPMRGRYQIVT